MQLDADRYPLLYSIRGALSPARMRAPTTGQDMTVTVPAGVEAGGLFDVPLPEPRLPSLGE